MFFVNITKLKAYLLDPQHKNKDTEALLSEYIDNHLTLNPDFVFNLKGHCNSLLDGRTYAEAVSLSENSPAVRDVLDSISEEVHTTLLSLFLTREREGELQQPKWAILAEISLTCASVGLSCKTCGSSLRIRLFDVAGEETRTYQIKPCPYPNSLSSYTMDFAIPSGKLVFANNFLRALFSSENARKFRDQCMDHIEKESGYYHTLSSLLGQKLYSEYSTGEGIGYIHVGNTSPVLLYDEESNIIRITVDNSESQDISEEELKSFKKNYRGYVCTDLWAVQFMDYDRLRKAFKTEEEFNHQLMALEAVIIPVPAGVYSVSTRLCDNHDEYYNGTISEIKLKENT